MYNTDYSCNRCRCNPCTCNCGCNTPSDSLVVCTPDVPPTPTVTVKDLLKLIESKCDDETCEIIQFEVALLYALIGIEHPGPDTPGHPQNPDVPGHLPEVPPGTTPPVIPTPVFQLVKNMVESLTEPGVSLKKKYPSALLLKKELMSLWKCMSDKHTHHGDWDTNFTFRDITATDDKCLLDGGRDYAPDKLKVITPVDVGGTVFNMIEGKKCLFESLVDNNITEPTKLSVLEGKWINYCDLKEVIDCVLPRTIITDCKEKCDDPNHDGVHEGKKLCDRVHDLEDCCIEVKGEEIKGLTCESKKLTLTKANGHKLQLPISQCVPPPFSWIDNFAFVKEKVPGAGVEYVKMGEVTVPKDGKYHISGNVHVREQCLTDSGGYFTRTYLAIQGGKGEPGTTNARSEIGVINNYHALGAEISFAAGFGKTLQLHAGDKVTFERGTYVTPGSTTPALVSFDIVGGISYVGV